MHFSQRPLRRGTGTLAGPTNHPSARSESYVRMSTHWARQLSSLMLRAFK
jgi:hypothetical protein